MGLRESLPFSNADNWPWMVYMNKYSKVAFLFIHWNAIKVKIKDIT